MLLIYNRNLERIGKIETFESLFWKEYYQDVGAIRLVAFATDENIRLLKEGHRVWQVGKNTSMMLKSVDRDSQPGLIHAFGDSAIARLKERYVLTRIDTVNAEQGMINIVTNELRGLSRLNIAPPQGFADGFESSYFRVNVFNAVQSLAVGAGLGFRMFFDGQTDQSQGRDVFQVYRGRNFTGGAGAIRFADNLGTLPQVRVIEDSSIYKNVAIVAGSGEGEDRTVIIVGDAQGDDRREVFIDARDIQRRDGESQADYEGRLYARGRERLNDRPFIRSVSSSIEAPTFGVEFDLGDQVLCRSTKFDIEFILRTAGFEWIVEGVKTKTTVIFGEPSITIFDEMRLEE